MTTTKKKEITSQAQSFKKGLTTYFKGVKSEWWKITWPERRQVIYETFIVLGVCFFFTVFVYILDIIFKWLFHLIPSR
jgi:preprotein translocase SecE subunit